MKTPYRPMPEDVQSMQRALQLVGIILDWDITFREAEDILTITQELLQTKVKLKQIT